MRKYFKIERVLKRELRTSPKADSLAWGLLRAVVHGSAASLDFSELCDAIACIQSRDVRRYLDAGDIHLSAYKKYADMSTESIRASRAIWSLLRKYPWSYESFACDRRQAAIFKMQLAEDQCAATNKRLGSTPHGELPAFIWRARFLIAQALGECRPQITEMLSLAGPGKGSTLSNKMGRVTQYYKYADFPYSCTRSALPYAYAAMSMDSQWMNILENSGRRSAVPIDPVSRQAFSRIQSELMLFSDCVDIVEHDAITFVPKTAQVDRPIAVGASLNVMLQLGVNAHLTKILQGIGVDLKDQSRNQKFAKLGSRFCFDSDGRDSPYQFSTIDLASASDTIATELVRLLLPSDWFAFLSDLRHESGRIDSDTVWNYNKFSAMGNGFTFPLESLIFWAVSKAAMEVNGLRCLRDDIAVYGDDIIIRHYGSAVVTDALEYCGFSINTEKSFYTGGFKESCGADFWNGTPVRPVYLKRSLVDDASLYYLANSIARVIDSGTATKGYYDLYRACVGSIKRGDRRYGPLNSHYDDCSAEFVFGITEDYLQVPLAALAHPGLRPWLRPDELAYLNKMRVFGRDTHGRKPMLLPDPNVPVYVAYVLRPKVFNGRASIRYYIALKNMARDVVEDPKYFWESQVDLAHLACAAAGQVTQRGHLEQRLVVRPVPNWDCGVSKRRVDRHPAMLMDLGS